LRVVRSVWAQDTSHCSKGRHSILDSERFLHYFSKIL